MTNRTEQSTITWPMVLAGGIVLVAVTVFVVQSMPESSTLGRVRREAEDLAGQLPDRTQRLIGEVRNRFRLAKAAFRSAKSESERLLTAQFEEAKQRGSVPPI